MISAACQAKPRRRQATCQGPSANDGQRVGLNAIYFDRDISAISAASILWLRVLGREGRHSGRVSIWYGGICRWSGGGCLRNWELSLESGVSFPPLTRCDSGDSRECSDGELMLASLPRNSPGQDPNTDNTHLHTPGTTHRSLQVGSVW